MLLFHEFWDWEFVITYLEIHSKKGIFQHHFQSIDRMHARMSSFDNDFWESKIDDEEDIRLTSINTNWEDDL